uniref:uL22m n=1 Tax=Polytomella magna TaxID=353565 RepID=UPI002240E4CA|nr:Chain Aq, uL22m [Polytomella magna]8APN_Aq Chain Aq, uL22m [Polytomella magna]8APO_Aq Chain Aq, uL22m [Polytomella magna]
SRPPLYARSGKFRESEEVQPYRTWYWYDAETESEERRKELRQQLYRDSGMSYYLNIPQSMKKLERVVRVIRNLAYDEAWKQACVLPLKAAGFVKEGLEHARKDAEEKGLDPKKLVVSTVYTAKGKYLRGFQPMGKGFAGRKTTRKTHLRIVLRENASVLPFAAQVVSPSRVGGASQKHLRDISVRYTV